MTPKIGNLFLACLSMACIVNGAGASSGNLTHGVFFEQRPGQRVLPSLRFTDDQGNEVMLGQYFRERPVVLVMGYYRCPTLCGVGLNATTRTLEEFPPQSVSRDFEFVFVSIDPSETFALAAEKKMECLRRLAWKPAESHWHFLVGEQSSQLAAQIGFHFRYDPAGKQYIHPSGLVILSPKGKITSYLLGIDYPGPEFERALAKARLGETGVIGPLLSILCYANDPAPGTVAYYVFIALRVGALATLIGLFLIIRMKRPRLAGKHSQI